jgi:TPR repeat protein
MYNNGQGVPKDIVQAASWFRKAHEQGYSLSENEISIMNRN